MDENSNKLDSGKLTDTELKILETCIDPTFSGKSTMEKCKIIGISRQSWYNAFKNPVFIDALNQANLEVVKSHVSDIVKACVKFGLNNSKNSADRKMLLTMAGLYSEKQEVKAEVVGDINNKVDFSNLSIEEIKELLNKN